MRLRQSYSKTNSVLCKVSQVSTSVARTGWKRSLARGYAGNLQVRRDSNYHVDTLDLYAARSRAAYIKQASVEFRVYRMTRSSAIWDMYYSN